MLMVGLDMTCATALAAPPVQAASSASAALPASAAHDGLVGADACASCHGEVSKTFAASLHARIGLSSCESCHGAGSAHIAAGGDATKIFNPAKTSGKGIDANANLTCTKCHAEMRGPFVYKHAVVEAEGCIACHSVHDSQSARLLKQTSIDALCTQCHSPAAAAAVHSVRAGSPEPKPCTDCHTHVHGSNVSAAFLN